MTIDTETGNIDIPLIAIKPPERRDFREELVGNPPLKRKRVEVVVECRDEVHVVGEVVRKQLKMDAEKLSDTQYKCIFKYPMPRIEELIDQLGRSLPQHA